VKYNYKMSYYKHAKIVFDYDRNLLMSSFVEVLFCNVICVPLHYLNGKSLFCGALFLWCMWSIIQCTEWKCIFHFSVEDRLMKLCSYM